MIAIVDYGAGNLMSVQHALQHLGADCRVVSSPAGMREADGVILPGVGAFSDAMRSLNAGGFTPALRDYIAAGRPFLGICLGMQLLFEGSEESPGAAGLGILPGVLRRLPSQGQKVPQIGWNALHLTRPHPLFRYVREGDQVYFVHSFHGTDCGESLLATTEYGGAVTAAVGKNNVLGCQFHPEKSGKVGLSILKAFAETEDFTC